MCNVVVTDKQSVSCETLLRRKKMAKYKSRATRLDEVMTNLIEPIEEVRTLKEELEEWMSNLQGTNLENTTKYEQLEEAVSLLEDLESGLEDIQSNADMVEFPGMF